MQNKKMSMINFLHLGCKVGYMYLMSSKVTIEDIGHSYNKISPTYQNQYLSTMHVYNDQILNQLLIDVPQGHILDLAGGSGYNSCFLKQYQPLYDIDLIDISCDMLNLCQNDDIHKICASMSEYMKNHIDNDYDAIVCTWALMYENPHQILKECYRLLKAGGYLYILVNSKKTLPQIRKIYPQLLSQHVQDIQKIMMDLPTPFDSRMLKKWGEKQKFTCVDSQEYSQDFCFPSWQEAGTFVTSTGALAGYDVMIDLKRQDIFNDFVSLLSDDNHSPCITHHFVKTIFKKELTI